MNHKKNAHTRFLSQAVQLEESSNPFFVRATLAAISLAIIFFIFWAAFTRIDEIARTSGEIVPQGYQQLVQHLDGGMVREITVQEGAIVERGEPLVMLYGAGAQEDLDRAAKRQVSLELQLERHRAFIDKREPDFQRFTQSDVKDQRQFYEGMTAAMESERKVISDQRDQKKHVISTLQNELRTAKSSEEIARDLYKRRASLKERGYMSDIQYLESKQRLNATEGSTRNILSQLNTAKAELSEFENRLTSLEARYRDEALRRIDDLSAEIDENDDLISKLNARVERLQLRAPVTGIIKGLSVNTVGEVVQPGQTIMEIVPISADLVAEVRIPPQHIGHVHTGQNVHVKFSSYDFSRYGFVPGKLERISATTFEGERGERFYRGRIILESDHVGKDAKNIIMPGMTVMADIVTGRKTLLQYLLKPVHNAMKTAFSER